MQNELHRRLVLAGFSQAIQVPGTDFIRMDDQEHYLGQSRNDALVLIKKLPFQVSAQVFAQLSAIPLAEASLPYSFVMFQGLQQNTVFCGVRAEINEPDFWRAPRKMLDVFETEIVALAEERIAKNSLSMSHPTLRDVVCACASTPFVPGRNAVQLRALLFAELNARRRPSTSLIIGRRGCGKRTTVLRVLQELGYSAYQLDREGGKSGQEVLSILQEAFPALSSQPGAVFMIGPAITDMLLGPHHFLWESLYSFLLDEPHLPVLMLCSSDAYSAAWRGSLRYQFVAESTPVLVKMVHSHYPGFSGPLLPDETTPLANPECTLRKAASAHHDLLPMKPAACKASALLFSRVLYGEGDEEHQNGLSNASCSCQGQSCWIRNQR